MWPLDAIPSNLLLSSPLDISCVLLGSWCFDIVWRMLQRNKCNIPHPQRVCVKTSGTDGVRSIGNTCRDTRTGASTTEGGRGVLTPALSKTGRVDPSPGFENEVARCVFRFLGYFGVGWPPYRRFDPPTQKFLATPLYTNQARRWWIL